MPAVCSVFFILLLSFIAHGDLKPKEKIIVITNNHTNFISVRCFSFDNNFTVVHLPSWGQYKFRVRKRLIYPSSTMFNCSTNMGTFVAYKHDYNCIGDMYDTCDWRFDETSAYLWEPQGDPQGNGYWHQMDYAPNYESLNRGGVIQGFFAN